ncbi:rhomboid family intramembrane serine protease [Xanthomonas nasturtii]|uniref:rhomboid family intramembrane serine protease n=1 Tax=Xanthomonas nasturtii TaxID=1843581 RepID=UPI002B230331|nr:rhomboid family intramembrane serine protease [Xanthomonas nasturtii]MEA9580113.1 rhomboid family intramembrane serine protease [Xanthomonas nasturtii]
MPQLPPVTKALLIANIGLFLLQWALGDLGAGVLPSDSTLSWLMLWPISNGFDAFSPGASFMPWQLLTYAFLHSGFNELFFSALVLFMFGAPLEQTWGQKRFLTYYLVCVAGAGVCQLLMAWIVQSVSPVLGASGAVFGLLFAYGLLFPKQRVMLLFPPIPMNARTLVIVVGLVEVALGLLGQRSGITYFAYLGGMLFGWLMIRYWRGQSPFGGSGGRKGGGGKGRKPPLRVVR